MITDTFKDLVVKLLVVTLKSSVLECSSARELVNSYDCYNVAFVVSPISTILSVSVVISMKRKIQLIFLFRRTARP